MAASDNPELQQDLIRLLHTENKSLRAQLQEAERKSHYQPPSYADTHLIEALRKQNQELLQERDVLKALANKCSDTNHIHASERVEHLTQVVATVTAEKNKFEQLHRRACQQFEERYSALEQEYRQFKQECSAQQQQLIYKSTGFDLGLFVHNMQSEQHALKHDKYKGPFSNVVRLWVPKKVSDLMKNPFMRFSHMESIWKVSGASEFLSLGPMHTFNPKAKDGAGGWERAIPQQVLTEQPGQIREILILHDHAWHYYGTYECVGSVTLSAKEVKEIGSEQMVNYAIKRTLPDAEHAPPNMDKLIRDMYSEGILRIEGFGFHRIGFDEAVYEALLQQGSWTGRDRKPQDRPNAAASPSSKPTQLQKQEQKGQRKPGGQLHNNAKNEKT